MSLSRAPIAVLVAACLLVQACGAGWRSQPDLAPGPVKPRQRAQVWHQGRAEQWHALILSADSVSGVPFVRPTDCDSCRVALPRAQVDSIRFGNPVAGFWKSFGLAYAGMLVIYAIAWGNI